ncbi:MAG: hypothetical protein AAGF85_06725 [Bacteroidota bacterium]
MIGRLKLSLLIITLVLLGGVTISLISASSVESDAVMTINGIQVSKEEFELSLYRNVAHTYNYFHLKWGAEDHPDFWQTSYEGETPSSYIKERTINQLIDLKVKQRLAVELGLIPDFTYDTFVKWWKQDNLDRKTRHETGKAVYGPLESSLANFYKYYYSNLFIKLQDQLNQTRFKIDDSQLASFYEVNKEKWFTYTPSVEVEYVEYRYQGQLEENRVYQEVVSDKKKMENGTSLKEAIPGSTPLIQYHRKTYTSHEKIFGEDNPNHFIKQLAFNLTEGDIKIMHASETSSIYLMKCLNKANEKIYSLNEVEDELLWYYRKSQYDNLIKDLSLRADVVIRRPVYDNLQIPFESKFKNSKKGASSNLNPAI